MNKIKVTILQTAIVLFGLTVIVLLILIPLTEGRAKDLDLFHIYADPFILYGYAASIPFFMGLYKLSRLIGYFGKGKAYTSQAIAVLSSIWYCAIIFGILIVGAGLYIKFFHNKEDDPAGFLALCMIATFAAALVAIAAVLFAKKLQKGIDRGDQNDLTV